MYIIRIKTLLSEWHYGPFTSKNAAEEWVCMNGYYKGEYMIIHLVPVPE